MKNVYQTEISLYYNGVNLPAVHFRRRRRNPAKYTNRTYSNLTNASYERIKRICAKWINKKWAILHLGNNMVSLEIISGPEEERE